MTLTLALQLIGALCLFMAAVQTNVPRVNLQALGLALWLLSILVGGIHA